MIKSQINSKFLLVPCYVEHPVDSVLLLVHMYVGHVGQVLSRILPCNLFIRH